MLKSVTFEGISGAGKTTCAALLKKLLARKGIRLLVFNEKEYEPMRGWVINWHRRPDSEKKFSLDDVRQVAEARSVIHGGLIESFGGNEFDWLIFDRCFYTSATYQASENCSPSRILAINREKGIIIPDWTFLFLGDPAICYERVKQRADQRSLHGLPATVETFEQISAYHKRYLALKDLMSNVTMIDASWPSFRAAKLVLDQLRLIYGES